MKKLFLLTIFTFITSLAWTQQTQDVVYLKNGSIIRGQVVEYHAGEDGQIKIRTADGSLFVYPGNEVLKMERVPGKWSATQPEDVNLDEYGGSGIAYGIAIGGGGLVGVPLNYHFSQMTALELGAFYRPVGLKNQADDIELEASFMLAGGGNFYFGRRLKEHKNKVKLNGISVKTGRSFGDFSQSFLSVGWAHESFRVANKNHSFVLELGLGVLASHFSGVAVFQYEEPDTQPLIYWKLHWKWYGR